MSIPLSFKGRVAIVTGAGGGLGRGYALLFAQKGASVVVNDLGGDYTGGGKSRMADKVVDEIHTAGGIAVANYDSVEDGDKIVNTAVKNFGRVDIVVNNAGILRDKSFLKMTNDDWDMIQRVHLRGSFMVTRAAWSHMRKQQFGRIIMTSSASGIYGNFGQANYSAAKNGLVGLSHTLAKEGGKYNIHCNVVAPVAGSRMTATVMPEDVMKFLDPLLVAPLVVYLCHESCNETGGLFETAGGWSAQLRNQRTIGYAKRDLTVEDVANNWDKITDFSKNEIPSSGGGTTVAAMERVKASEVTMKHTPTSGGESNMSQYSGKKIGPVSVSYTADQLILYALGVGAKVKHTDNKDLHYLYEGHENFSAVPSYSAIIGMNLSTGMLSTMSLIDYSQVLHGEQAFQIHTPLPAGGVVKGVAKVLEVLDKGKGAVIVVEVKCYDETMKTHFFTAQSSIYVRGAGGYGGKYKSNFPSPSVSIPNRAPDSVIREVIPETQAALYRLSGDKNPLHIDSNFAAMGGFSQPILHGLCSYGHAVRHVIHTYCGNDPSRLTGFKGRFTKPVLPGHTLITEMWESRNDGKVIVRCKIKETGHVVIDGAYADVKFGSNPQVGTPVDDDGDGNALKSSAVFYEIEKRIQKNPQVSNINGIFHWIITKEGKPAADYVIDLKNKPPSLKREAPKSTVDVSITLSDEDFISIVQGKITASDAFFKGKLKVKGNILLTQKLESLLKVGSNL
ncbi:Peroxisomal multifunctional enzyme type 2 [Oopsacas minuta]|uniref:Peroxisomal multifunctional enzyme type 2 n=1 Tax=Oopsacas minuta TaxID=111878 RepID=A0AAV7JNJ2_9METZ|nr:Peroxisomal multifunctional enzyme type 2 [Oopsacas minuta]